MKMQIQLAVALSALFHTPKGRHSVWIFSGMIHLKIGKMAAKTEIEYQSANELDDPSDSSETRKLCENWWGHRRKRRGEAADEPQVSGEEEPDRSDRKRRRAAASSVVKATDPRDEGEPASNFFVLTPNIWEDGPTYVRFAYCRNKQGPEEEALQKSLAEWKASQEKEEAQEDEGEGTKTEEGQIEAEVGIKASSESGAGSNHC